MALPTHLSTAERLIMHIHIAPDHRSDRMDVFVRYGLPTLAEPTPADRRIAANITLAELPAVVVPLTSGVAQMAITCNTNQAHEHDWIRQHLQKFGLDCTPLWKTARPRPVARL